MKRALATSLVLVNWEGVFYQRYLLNRRVTGLEGVNGAGKTTVMVACYVALLPDLSRLRFTGIGEKGESSEDRGIWGRLGDPSSPAYSVLEIVLADGETTVLAGVHLEKKAFPRVEAKCFLITGLQTRGSLANVMLLTKGQQQLVPELPELGEAVARHGGRLQILELRDYFTTLFDLGITPLRMTSDEDRKNMNEMLRTCMTGGISKTLTSDLRSFLLKEESSLAGTLVSMRNTLDACRRTRADVAEAQRLEHEISSVYEVGEEMFATALVATRERAEELKRRVDEAQRDWQTESDKLEALSLLVEELRTKHHLATTQLGEATTKAGEATVFLKRVLVAHQLAGEVAELVSEVMELAATATAAELVLKTAEGLRSGLGTQLGDALARSKQAAAGLHDHDVGLDLVRRSAEAHRAAKRSLAAAKRTLARDVDATNASDLLASTSLRCTQIDGERARLASALAMEEQHRREFRSAAQALEEIRAAAIADVSAYDEARCVIVTLFEKDALATALPSLRDKRDAAKTSSDKQRTARQRATALGFDLGATSSNVLADYEAGSAAVQEKDIALRELDRTIQTSETELATLATTVRQLEERQQRWLVLDEVATRAERTLESKLRTREETLVAREEMDRRRFRTRTRLDELTGRRDTLISQASAIELAGGGFSNELLGLRDRLNAELVAARFEDIAVERAAFAQASLGPLLNGLIVDDTRAAATELRGLDLPVETVMLVSTTHSLELNWDSDDAERAVVVEDGPAIRVTRIPANPTLGSKARARRVKELRDEAAQVDLERDAFETELRQISETFGDLDILLGSINDLELGDASKELARCREDSTELSKKHDQLQKDRVKLSGELVKERTRVSSVGLFLQDAHLLDPPDHSALHAALVEEYRRAKEAKEYLVRIQDARARLTESMESLRRLPLDPKSVSQLESQAKELGAERERLFLAVEALDQVTQNLAALEWTDAEEILKTQEALTGVLSEEATKAHEHYEALSTELQASQTEEDKRRKEWQGVDGRRTARVERHALRVDELRKTEVDDTSAEAVASAKQDVAALEQQVTFLGAEERRLNNEHVERQTDHRHKKAEVDELAEDVRKLQSEAAPAEDRWQRLQAASHKAGVMRWLAAGRFADLKGRGTVNLWPRAKLRRDTLRERATNARGGDELVPEIDACFGDSDAESADQYLAAWLAARDWIRRRVPSQIADVDDPLEALRRLQDRLKNLKERLDKHETDLRTGSEGIASTIQVSIRRARATVTRLNKGLTGVRFGNVDQIDVEVERVEQMDKVLTALREGKAQDLLFQPNLPIEEALDQIFRKYGGGLGSGKKLLDYREYIELVVRIRRRGQTIWEVANPSRLSTGEAIGVGAALMMVVLAEWEQNANFLRGKRAAGSLRFLFLDEAARLSPDSLVVLFDLCDALELQLLIAAPEIAKVEGTTAYRLVRTTTEQGVPTVTVSGRRATAKA